MFHIAGDLTLNVLDHDNCKKMENFLNLLYQNNMIPIINKSTRVTRKTATAINYIIINCFNDTNFKTAIFKSDISDYFPIGVFKVCENPSESYKIILTKFLCIYDAIFPKKKIKVNKKDIQSPWITAGIKKSLKRKHRLYETFLKTKNEKNEDEYKNYKPPFEKKR